MSKQLLVLGCSQTKKETEGLLPAIDRYDGTSYRILRNYIRDREWPSNLSVAILSAKYGLMGGLTNIEDYDERMTAKRAAEWAPKCTETLNDWAGEHSSIHFSLGKDYLPAVTPAIEKSLKGKSEIFKGPIGMKNSQVKNFIENIGAPLRHNPNLPKPGSGSVTYFLPDWDDLLDENFNFETDQFSGTSPRERNDKHCSVLMQPKRMCDGILVSLAQHIISKGPLRRIMGTEASSLAPKNLRNQFGLVQDQSLFGDCGAFSYVNEEEPSISIEQAVALYELHGFDFGASVDHIPVPFIIEDSKQRILTEAEREARVKKTLANAKEFLALSQKRNTGFIPVGTIQALTPDAYAKNAKYYYELGYRHLAIGGLVPLPDSLVEEIVTKVMNMVNRFKQRPWVHLFGIFRPKLQARFRELRVDSFDSASYFRKSWLRSDQNYLASNGKWYAALRVPMTSDGRTRKRLEQSGMDIEKLEDQEAQVMNLLCRYNREEVEIKEVLDAVIDYDEKLTRTSEPQSMRARYEQTLKDRPWKSCDCPFCKDAGIHVLIFRGANRNKRRGAHNTLMLYGSLERN